MFVDLSMRRHRCLFTVHANEREVINYRLTHIDEVGGRERVQLVEGRSRSLALIPRKSTRFPTYVGRKIIPPLLAR